VVNDTKEKPNVNLSRLRKLKYALPLAALVMACTATATTAKPTASAAGTPIKIAILSDCKGAFGAFYGADVGGAIQAFVEQTGAKVVNKNDPIKGMKGGSIAGHPIKLVGIGCANDSADLAISETKRLVEKLGADILIGPLSGDESIAVAKYAKAHPKKTFVNGTAGALDTTMIVRAPNFFRWNGDGAQWNAGTGWVAYNVLGWRKVDVIMDDYSFAWTSGAGFIAEFCALGGTISKRVFPPLNTTDYSSYVAQLDPPNSVDGYFWVVGGTGTLPALKAYEQKYGQIVAKQHMGNLFFGTPGTFTDLGLRLAGSYVGGGGTGADVPSASLTKFTALTAKTWNQLPPLKGKATVTGVGNLFFVNYYVNATGLIKGLKAVKGDLSGGQKALQKALAKTTVTDPNGYTLKLDANRQGIADTFVQQLYDNNGTLGIKTIYKVVGVPQTFGGVFSPSKPPPSETVPECVKGSVPWKVTKVNA
jgi:branched-chain amino acid transport system substrate-binding protein